MSSAIIKIASVISGLLLLLAIIYNVFAEKPSFVTIAFNTDGGTPIKDITYLTEGDIILEPLPTTSKVGYDFQGWFLDASRTKKFESGVTKIKRDSTLYALFVEKEFSIVYVTNCNQNINSQVIKYNYSIGSEPTLHEPGKEFKGWYTESTFINKFDFTNTKITKDYTLYAKWDYIDCEINFYDGGSLYHVAKGKYSFPITFPANPSSSGYRFDGWYLDSSFNYPYNQTNFDVSFTSLYAKMTKLYQLDFVILGNVVGTKYLAEDEEIDTLSPTASSGYYFDGWFTDTLLTTRLSSYVMPGNDMTVYGDFIIDDGLTKILSYGNTTLQDVRLLPGMDLVLSTPGKNNSTFIGWYYDSLFTNPVLPNDVMPINDITIYAKFIDYPYIHFYNSNIGSIQLEPGTIINLPGYSGYMNPTEAFAGWSTSYSSIIAPPTLMPSNDLTLYAHFVVDKYVVNVIIDQYYDSVLQSNIINAPVGTFYVSISNPSFIIPVVSINGYNYSGFSINGGPMSSSSSVTIYDNLTITLFYEGKGFKLTVAPAIINDHYFTVPVQPNLPPVKTIKAGEKIEIQNPPIQNTYIFYGYSNDYYDGIGQLTDIPEYMPDHDITIFAVVEYEFLYFSFDTKYVEFWDVNFVGEPIELNGLAVSMNKAQSQAVINIPSYYTYYDYSTRTLTPYPVVAIGYGGFAGASAHTITLPNTIKAIFPDGFSFCQNLKNINIPDDVVYIGQMAFSNDTALETINLNSVKYISSRAFDGCTKLLNLTLSPHIIYIGAYAFRNCVKINNLYMPMTLKEIGLGAFSNCTALVNIGLNEELEIIRTEAFSSSSIVNLHIPSTTIIIEPGFVMNATKLLNITVETLNSVFASVNGVLYKKDPQILHSYPVGRVDTSYTVEPSTYAIDESAFSSANNLTDIVLNDELEAIFDRAFYNCPIDILNITKNVSIIGKNAFQGSKIQQINVDPLNNNFTSDSIALYSKDFTTLILYPVSRTSKTYTVDSNCLIIEESAFYRSVLESVNLANVERINKEAFAYSSSLKTITLPNTIVEVKEYAFYYCSSLTTVSINGNLNEIGDYAFAYCSKLQTINFNSSLKKIGSYSFSSTSALASVNLPVSLETINSRAFYYSGLTSIDLSSNTNLTSIQSKAFESSKNLTTAIIPPNLEVLPLGCFINCDKLLSVVLTNKLEVIDAQAFDGCTKLQTVTLSKPNALKAVYEYAFNNCTSLTSFEIQKNQELMFGSVLAGCTALTSITIDAGNTFYVMDDDVLFTANKMTLIKYLAKNTRTSYQVPESVAVIDRYAFENAKHLTSLSYPTNLAAIFDYAFKGCTGIKSIYLFTQTQFVYASVFAGWTNTQTIYAIGLVKGQFPLEWSYTVFKDCNAKINYMPDQVKIEFVYDKSLYPDKDFDDYIMIWPGFTIEFPYDFTDNSQHYYYDQAFTQPVNPDDLVKHSDYNIYIKF